MIWLFDGDTGQFADAIVDQWAEISPSSGRLAKKGKLWEYLV